ncbi:MAG: hypothetical protein JNK31_03800 [Candidatus Competibacter sp.]|nr:hypothetical protein [Candidatus Competibacter sp.]
MEPLAGGLPPVAGDGEGFSFAVLRAPFLAAGGSVAGGGITDVLAAFLPLSGLET